jgi:hypothetical protein
MAKKGVTDVSDHHPEEWTDRPLPEVDAVTTSKEGRHSEHYWTVTRV